MSFNLKVPMPGEQVARLIGFALVVLFVVSVAVLIWMAGKRSAESDAVKTQLEVAESSGAISRETGDTVAVEQASTWKAAQADEGVIRARIDAQPRAAGPADPDILRVAREAHARAVCAESRVHGARCGNDTATAAE